MEKLTRWVIQDIKTGHYVNEDMETGYVDDVCRATFFRFKREVVQNIRENESTDKEKAVKVILHVFPS